MKSKLLLTILLLAAQAAATTVTGIVTDPSGYPYTGTFSAYLIASGPPKVGSLAINPSIGPIPLSALGAFSTSLTDTGTILPSGSVWRFTVCGPSIALPPDVPSRTICFEAGPIAVTGASLNISATLNAAAARIGPPPLNGDNVYCRLDAANCGFTGQPSFPGTGAKYAGSTSGQTIVKAAPIASGTATLPANTGTVAETNMPQTWTAPQTFPDVVTSVTPAVDVRAFGAIPDDGLDDTAAFQAAITAATVTKRIYASAGVYNVTGFSVFSGGYEFDGDAAEPQTGIGGTTLSVSAAGTACSIGSDDGNARDLGEYDGPQGTIFRNIIFTSSLVDGTLLNGFGTYGLNTYGIRDWRGGNVVLDNVRFKNLNYGFWGVQSDIDRFSRIITDHNSVGLYLGPRSDNFQIWGYNGGNSDDTNIWIDGAHGGAVTQSQVSGCSATTPMVKVGNAGWSVNAIGIDFDNLWVEGPQTGLNVCNSVFMLGKSSSFANAGGADDVAQTSQINLSNIFVINNAGARRVKYLVENGNSDNIQVNWLHGVPGTYDSVFQFSGPTSPQAIAFMYNHPNTPLLITNSGAGTPVINRIRFANGKIYLENGTDAALNVRLNSGRSAVQDVNLTISSLDSNKFNFHWIASSNTYVVEDGGSSGFARLSVASGGLTKLNSLGATAVQLNVTNGAGTGGTAFGDGLGGTVATVSNTGKGVFNGGLQAGSGNTIASDFNGTATLTFTAISPQTCQEQPLTVTGATAGKATWASPASSIGNTNLSWSAWTSGSSTVSVRVCNPTAGSITPSAVSWTGWVLQ